MPYLSRFDESLLNQFNLPISSTGVSLACSGFGVLQLSADNLLFLSRDLSGIK